MISAKSMDDLLVEMIELPDHPWFIACQAHPEFLSTPRGGHPLFIGFVRAARAYHAKRMGLQIGRLMIGTNANDILARTIASGRYEVHGVVPTTSPS